MTNDAPPAWAWWTVFFGSWVLLCGPLLVVTVPPLADYPNHMVRMDIIAELARNPGLARMFQLHWGIIPDLAIDAFMPFVVGVLPLAIAGRLLLALILLLEVAGATACAAALHGGRTWWSLGVGLVAYNMGFMLGFLNFSLSLGAAMGLAACWIWLRPRTPAPVTAAMGFAAGAVLFFGHLLGLFFFLALIGSFEASRLWASLRCASLRHPRPPGRGKLRSLLACWPVAVAALPFALLYPLTGLAGAAEPTVWLSLHERLTQGMAAFTNYNLVLDVATTALVIGCIVLGAIRRRIRIAPGAVLAVVLVFGLYAAMPNAVKGTAFVVMRFAVMLGFLAFIAFRVEMTGRTSVVFITALAVVLTARMAVVGATWWDYRTDVADTGALLAKVSEGDRIAQVNTFDSDEKYLAGAPAAWRLSNGQSISSQLMVFAVTERLAFWPHVFANPSQQPIAYRPPFEAIRASGRSLPTYADLVARRAAGNPPAANRFCAFDLVVIGGIWAEPQPATLAPDWLQLIELNRSRALYRVRAPRSCLPAPQGIPHP
jgi:hypothetical protein